MASEAQVRAAKKYDEENTVKLCIKLNKKTDADILKKLEEVKSKQGYIKSLIRNDLCSKMVFTDEKPVSEV